MQRCFTLLKKRMLFECLAVKEYVRPEIEIFLVESSTATKSSNLHSLPVSELPLPLLISSLLCFTFPVSFLTFQNRFPELLAASGSSWERLGVPGIDSGWQEFWLHLGTAGSA